MEALPAISPVLTQLDQAVQLWEAAAHCPAPLSSTLSQAYISSPHPAATRQLDEAFSICYDALAHDFENELPASWLVIINTILSSDNRLTRERAEAYFKVAISQCDEIVHRLELAEEAIVLKALFAEGDGGVDKGTQEVDGLVLAVWVEIRERILDARDGLLERVVVPLLEEMRASKRRRLLG